MTSKEIIEKLPYRDPFLFVDQLDEITEEGVHGRYTFPKDAYFYEGHFKEAPVTPGVLLTECMAQIGLVCLGIYIHRNVLKDSIPVAMSSTAIDFYVPVYPGETVLVKSTKKYFRFHKLKCTVSMYNEADQLVAKGEIAGMSKPIIKDE